MKSKIFIALVGILLSFFAGVYVSPSLVKSDVPTAPSERSKSNDANKGNYQLVQNAIRDKFKVEGYVEVTKGIEAIVVVPDRVAGEQNTPPEGIYHRQKNFIFKHESSGTVILLSVSRNEKALENYWTHSIGYDSKVHNSPNGDFKDTYADVFPKMDVYVYSFEGKGYSINLTSFANATDQLVALDHLAQFTDKLALFLKESSL